jgi:hypothetical protein
MELVMVSGIFLNYFYLQVIHFHRRVLSFMPETINMVELCGDTKDVRNV